MIRASRAESLWYDDLSILLLKSEKGSETAAREYRRICDDIVEDIGSARHVEVIHSAEMTRLIATNRLLFNLIDHLKSPDRPPDKCYDNDVDQLNLQRNRDKAALQARWFPDQPFTEVKLGYKDAPLST